MGDIQLRITQAGLESTPGTAVPATRKLFGAGRIQKSIASIRPIEERGTYDSRFTRAPGLVTADGTYEGPIYAHLLPFWLGVAVNGTDPVTTLPGSPTSRLTATAISGTPLSLSSQPINGHQILQLIVAGGSTFTAAAITITGTDKNNVAQSEIVSVTANGTYYTKKYFKTVNASGIVIAGISPTTATLAVNGIDAFQRIVTPGAALKTMTSEFYDGTTAWQGAFGFVPELKLSAETNGDAKLSATLGFRDRAVMGGGITAGLPDPLDVPFAGWQQELFIDPISATPFTTEMAAKLTKFELSLKNQFDRFYGGDNSPLMTSLSRGARTVDLTGTIKWDDLNEYNAWLANTHRLLGIRMTGEALNTAQNRMMEVVVPGQYESLPVGEYAGATATAFSLGNLYDPVNLYAFRFRVVNDQPTF